MNQPVINFVGYQIETIDYRLLDPTSNEAKTYMENADPEIEILNGITEDYDQGKVHFSIKYPDKELFRLIELEVVGYFKIPEKTRSSHEKDKIKSYLANNGTAMVYPYVRSILSIISSLDSSNSIVMPTINTSELHAQSLEDHITNRMTEEEEY